MKIVVTLLFWSLQALALNDDTGLKTSVAVDLVGQSRKEQTETEKAFEAREVEFAFYAPIDHLFNGVLMGAAHNENGESLFELHEAYISSSRLVPRSRIKAGQFFIGLGRLNQTHRHDWLFTVAPKVHEEFFDEEGVLDSGMEYSYLLPTPFYLDVTFGVTTGHTYGHTHVSGSRPTVPNHYARFETYKGISEQSGVNLGLNFLKRSNSASEELEILGLDFLLKFKKSRHVPFLLQSEIWHRTITPKLGDASKTLGAYFYPQYGISENLFIGLRLDGYSVLSRKNSISGEKVANLDHTISPSITYQPSEFSRFRLTYFTQQSDVEGEKEFGDEGFYVQFTFILGAHPAHDF